MTLLFAFRNVIYFPMLCALMAIVKYRFGESREMEEYGDVSSDEIIDDYVSRLSLAFTILLLTLLTIDSTILYENLSGYPTSSVFARGYNILELVRFCITFLLICSYVFLSTANQLLHAFICVILGLFMSMLYIYYMPFYRKIANF